MFISREDARMIAAELFALVRPILAAGGNGKAGNGAKPTVPKRLWTLEETARYMGRTKNAIEHLVQRGTLKSCIVRLDGRVYIDRIALDKLIESGRV